MNYKESKKILQLIKQAKNILINCHVHPDADSVGGALALALVIKRLDKKVKIVCADPIGDELRFLTSSELIEETDFSKLDYEEYDLFLALDTSTWDRVCGSKDLPLPDIKIIQIDHHKTNSMYGQINLVDYTKKSNCEILYKVFEDWQVKIDEKLAQYLLTGIIGDTGSFQYETPPETLELAAKLMRLGGNKEEISKNLSRSVEFGDIKIIGELLRNAVFDKKHKFIWCAIPYKFIKNYSEDPKLDAVDLLLQGTRGATFGIRMVEKAPKEVSVSLRARDDFDTSKISVELGGGGHPVASGAKIVGMNFNEVVEKVLQTARKYASQ